MRPWLGWLIVQMVIAGCLPAILYVLQQIHERLCEIVKALGVYDKEEEKTEEEA
jgi:hypothetical protein